MNGDSLITDRFDWYAFEGDVYLVLVVLSDFIAFEINLTAIVTGTSTTSCFVHSVESASCRSFQDETGCVSVMKRELLHILL